jgi:hypothetical protein
MRTRSLAAFVLMLGVLGGAAVLAQKTGRVQRVNSPPPPASVPIAPSEPLPPPAEETPFLPGAVLPDDEDGDPMKDIDAFVEQNRRKARESIARLTKEAEELRARLRKVEMAIERWKSLAGALERPEPGELEPAAVQRAPLERAPLESVPVNPPPPADLPSAPAEPAPLPPSAK